jgi:hypothetical protein
VPPRGRIEAETEKGKRMEPLRVLAGLSLVAPCCRCKAGQGSWDRIAGKPYCPNCQEALAQGEAPPLVERTERRRCSICNQPGTVRYATFPLHAERAVEFDLCPEHLRNLLARRLGARVYQQFRRRLQALGLRAGQIFLLHEAFYDASGRALQPVHDLDVT